MEVPAERAFIQGFQNNQEIVTSTSRICFKKHRGKVHMPTVSLTQIAGLYLDGRIDEKSKERAL